MKGFSGWKRLVVLWETVGDEQRREMRVERGGMGGGMERHECIEASAVGLSKVHYLTIRSSIAIDSKYHA